MPTKVDFRLARNKIKIAPLIWIHTELIQTIKTQIFSNKRPPSSIAAAASWDDKSGWRRLHTLHLDPWAAADLAILGVLSTNGFPGHSDDGLTNESLPCHSIYFGRIYLLFFKGRVLMLFKYFFIIMRESSTNQ